MEKDNYYKMLFKEEYKQKFEIEKVSDDIISKALYVNELTAFDYIYPFHLFISTNEYIKVIKDTKYVSTTRYYSIKRYFIDNLP